MRPPLDLRDDVARQCALPEDQDALADVTKAADPRRQARAEQQGHEDEEARHERPPAHRCRRDQARDDAHRSHAARGPPSPSSAHAIRLAARSHRTGPSLSAACRTAGPGSRRSARTITGGSPGSVTLGSTGLALSVAYRAQTLGGIGVVLTTT